MTIDELSFDGDGLVTAVVQDAATAQVRMVGWMSREAVEETMRTGTVHFWSRSRQELWKKGETSGNHLRVVDLIPDCDGDTILVRAHAAGPTCHTGSASCFATGTPAGFSWLDDLAAIIDQRLAASPDASYTAALVAGGVDAPARKVLEEAGEVVIAAKNHATAPSVTTQEYVVAEAADVLYHLLVLLAERNIPASHVITELRSRHRPDGDG